MGNSRSIRVAHGNDGVEIIDINSPGALTLTLDLNYPDFPDSCFTS